MESQVVFGNSYQIEKNIALIIMNGNAVVQNYSHQANCNLRWLFNFQFTESVVKDDFLGIHMVLQCGDNSNIPHKGVWSLSFLLPFRFKLLLKHLGKLQVMAQVLASLSPCGNLGWSSGFWFWPVPPLDTEVHVQAFIAEHAKDSQKESIWIEMYQFQLCLLIIFS